jgi:hypothetical protein
MIDEFEIGLEDGPGAPARATVYTGLRGVGKTVMLNEVADAALEQGWITIPETLTPGFLDRLINEHLPTRLQKLDGTAKRRMTGVTAPLSLGGLTWETVETHPAGVGLRTQIEQLAGLVQGGILFTLDEIHKARTPDLVIFCAEIQHAFREELPVAFVGAGLPKAVDEALTSADSPLTFLRRADRHLLGSVDLEDVKTALQGPIEQGGRRISEEALQLAAEATKARNDDGGGGYPFLIQLVGYHAWNQHREVEEITVADVRRGISIARRKLGSLVLGPAVDDLSPVDKTFMLAMAQDDGPSKMRDLMERMQVDKNYASQYQGRLLKAGVIVKAGSGVVDFALPGMREYLRDHAASIANLS